MLANKLNYGDTIGVVGIANSLELENRYDDFTRAEELFKNKGFKIKRAKNVLEDYYGSAGTRGQKAEEFMKMFLDKEIKAIICLTGGETCNTMLDLLDYELIKKNPKIVVGYSDATVLLQAIHKKTGLITFQGGNFVDYGRENALAFYEEFERVFIKQQDSKFVKGKKEVIRKGNIEKIMIGTNLGSMMYQMATPYFPDLEDKILAIESYHTSPNECQRRFAQLKYAGIFEQVKGIIVGYNYDLQKDGCFYPQMEDILLEYTKEYDFPIIKCNDFGHKMINSIMPIGCLYKIDSDLNKVTIVDKYLNS